MVLVKAVRMAAKYDTIGLNYAELRKPDVQIAAAIRAALGQAQTILNVGRAPAHMSRSIARLRLSNRRRK